MAETKIQVYNSLTRKKEPFETLSPGQVKMYLCGPTVYDFLHIGNFRGAIFFNSVRNWLEHRGYKVTFVYNYTDVDDRIINKAKEQGVKAIDISEKYIKEFEKDFARLNLRKHTHNPKVTEFISQIIDFVKDLIDKKRAYEVDGDVYYDVQAFPQYGKLSNKSLKDLEAGYRIEVDARKKHVSDFALWKKAKDGEASWPSPWGDGRPGWHIECSSMIRTLLGDSIDIHAGGLDLVFPHHENEIAQSEGATEKPFARYWMHNNMLEFGNQKMSKSLGNVRTGHTFMDEYHPEVLKMMMLSNHYRSTIDFSDESILRVIQNLAKYYSAMNWAEQILKTPQTLTPVPAKFVQLLHEIEAKIAKSMDDDFNTAESLSHLFEAVRAYNNLARRPGKVTPEMFAVSEAFLPWLKKQGQLLALFQEAPGTFLTVLDDMLLRKKNLERAEIDRLVVERSQARTNKDFQKSDEMRKQLEGMGIAVMDSPSGSTWEVSKALDH